MKKRILTVLAPAILGVSAIVPMCSMTSCNNTKSVERTINTGDSVAIYKFKLDGAKEGTVCSVALANKTAEQEQVYLHGQPTFANITEEFIADAEGYVSVPLGYYIAPSYSTSSEFNMTFNYSINNQEIEGEFKNVKFNYNVDYDVDLKDGKFDPETQSKVTPAEKKHWDEEVAKGLTIGEIYMKDVEANPIIFQSDARYTTSLNIAKAIENKTIKNLKSFKAYFNDIYKDEYGLGVHMNYEVKGDDDSTFSFAQGSKVFTFKNFDLNFSLQTLNGYDFSWQSTSAKKYFLLTDQSEQPREEDKYGLIGRMKGNFVASVVDDGTVVFPEQTVEYDDVIDNYPEETNEETPEQVAFMFAYGIICLTYDFSWGVAIPELKIQTNYGKNIPN